MSEKLTPKQREVNRVVEALTQAIGQHKLRPGTRLIEAQIVEALQANRNHVQTALQRMAGQGIVIIEPNYGAMVSRPTAKQAQEVFIARSAIECAIISCITPEKMALFAEEIARQQHNEHQSFHAQDRRRIVYELGAFHELMARIAGNDVLRGILDNLMILSSLIVMLYQQDVTTHCQCDEHKNIIAALQEGDTQRAQNLMSDHLHALLQQLNLNETPPNLMTLSQALYEISD